MPNYTHFIPTQTKYKLITLLIFGALSALAMPPYYIVPFLCIGLSTLFFLLNKESARKKGLLYGFSFGFGFGCVGMYWLANALLIDNGTFAWLIPFAWAGMGLLFGIFYALPAVLCLFFTPGIRRLLAFSSLFTLFEWIRSWIFTGFPWNLVGSAWSFSTQMIQSASVWGIYGLSFITVCTFCTLAFLPKKKPLILSIVFLFGLYLSGVWRLYSAPNEQVWGITLRLVQPNIPQSLKWDADLAQEHLSKLIRLSRKNNEQITHVIWPEAAVPYLIDQDEDERVRLMSAVRQGGTLITGGLRGANPHTRTLANSIFILDDFANIQSYYDKFHLVPFGEFAPFRSIIPLDKIVPIGSDFQRGKGVRTMLIPKAPPASLLVCYEAIFSGQVADKDKRPSWMINVSNDAWYGLSAGPYQHFEMTRLRAVEEGLPMVRVANNGISAVINSYGKIINSLDLGQEGVLDSALPKSIPAPLYAKTGVWPLLGLMIIILLLCSKKQK